MAILRVVLILSVLVAQSAFARVTDQLAGDQTESYLNIEFSHDNRYAIVLVAKSNENENQNLYDAYLSKVNSKGELVPRSGRGIQIGEAPMLGMPQWGYDKTGPYAVMLDLEGQIVSIRPDGSNKPKIKTYKEDGGQASRMMRAFPYPSKNSTSGKQFVTYQIRNQRAGIFKQVLVEVSAKDPKHQVIYEEKYLRGRSPGPIVSFARWINETFKLTYGAYEPGCTSHRFDKCPAQLKMITMSKGQIASNDFVTSDPYHKVDAFPFQQGSTLKMFAGVDLTDGGIEYLYNSKSKEFEPKKAMQLNLKKTQLIEPSFAQSMEPFQWKNTTYVVYQVTDHGLGGTDPTASAYPGEIWMYNSSTGHTCRVSKVEIKDPEDPDKRARVDAEPVLFKDGSSVNLYYHSSKPIPNGDKMIFDLRKIKLGGKSQFDKTCGS